MYNIICVDTKEYPLSEEQVRARHPEMLIPEPFCCPDGYAFVNVCDMPGYNPATHKALSLLPVRDEGGAWSQAWEIVVLTPEESLSARMALVPTSVSRAQGKAALIKAGHWPAVLSFVASIEDDQQRALADVALNDTTEWARASPFLSAVAQALEFTDAQLDDLFIAASKVVL